MWKTSQGTIDLTSSTKNCVAVQLLGGLGNQLFQYCSARTLAKRLGATLLLDCTAKESWDRKFLLDRYFLKAHVADPREIRRTYFEVPGNLGRKITQRIHAKLPEVIRIGNQPFKILREKRHLHYDDRIENISGRIYLIGWWQSYRYFKNYLSDIKEDLQTAGLNIANSAWQLRIRRSNSVCVHVRRGDYFQHADYYGLCQRSYFDNSMALMRQRIAQPHFFIFSDDLVWCRETFEAPDLSFVDANGSEGAVEELALMASCGHHIISNSTLSWWAAWLATKPMQIVVAPTPWNLAEPSDADLIPPHWIRIAQR